MQSRGEEVGDAQVPAVAAVLVLHFGAEIGDPALRLDEIDLAPAETIDAPACGRGGGPHIAREQLEKLRLARTVGADESPALPRMHLEREIAQHPPAPTLHARGVQRDAEP